MNELLLYLTLGAGIALEHKGIQDVWPEQSISLTTELPVSSRFSILGEVEHRSNYLKNNDGYENFMIRIKVRLK